MVIKGGIMEHKIANNLDWIIGDDDNVVIDYYIFKNKKYGGEVSHNIKKLVYDFYTNILNEFKNKNKIHYKMDDVEFRKRIKKIISCFKNDIDKNALNKLLVEFTENKNNVEPYSLLFLLIIKSDIENDLILDKKNYLKYIKQMMKLDMKDYSGFSNLFDELLVIEKERMKAIDVLKFYI